ncbi:uncharacterized protein CcaverHIS019_0112590 [Cutaneotrichosporon cavernicola]|uniref:Major facilitator superfamily (MFS) profile domain-containing protein n=1 Tax=Cutaneotrichosporon cavernicola TaxID=279322 RepID=A0AA48HZX4_9TREE|nr:uncharacterized protein CcaverHIS019_0112590 [Cutaneotrichosporon cavernicola]BEI88541.1 hypothetical protein CcaverHIS019_0112590 [Cutaneotrichosporon cavernicola]BEI96314.1 hypothetical protein CcaverHIS631_0112630 [Cutaneotrichosporon cavernicola]BEJ04085.1 hypothetical protein CcaverHIS641_0112600 [Cutaneotrichosporon cavernicola]
MFSSHVFKAIAWACISSWYYGYHLAELNYPANGLTCHPSPNDGTAPLRPCLGLDAIKYSAVTALLTAGGLVGSALSDSVVRSQGVPGGIAWTGWLNLVGALMMALAPHWGVLALGRFIAGLSCGLAICLVPPYLATVARTTPELASRSGQIGSLNQLAIVIGICSSQVMGMLLTGPTGDKPGGWRYVLVVSALASIVQIGMGEHHMTQNYVPHDPDEPRDEAAAPLLPAPGTAAPNDQLSIRAVLSNPSLRGPALLITTIMVLQQLSGVNAVLFYSTPVLSSVLQGAGAGALSVGITVVNALMTLPAIALVDKLGRRTLLLASATSMAFMSIMLAVGLDQNREYLSSFAIVAFIAAFAIGLGPVPFLLVSDMMPAPAIPAVSSLALSGSWITNFIVAMGFIPLRDALSEPADPNDPGNGARLGEGRVFYVFTFMLVLMVSVVLRGVHT